ncbi:hypothetical protein SNEBB_009375 [Seison nebaliae]|nr:hypothetical protein SNEBB_009375 [Seison nebaliae]
MTGRRNEKKNEKESERIGKKPEDDDKRNFLSSVNQKKEMNYDRYRLQPLIDTISYKNFIKENEKKKKKTMTLREEREENRPNNSFRSINIEKNVVPNATASTYFAVGNTKLICTIYGPLDKSRNEEKNDLCQIEASIHYLPFATIERSPLNKQASDTLIFSSFISQTFQSVIMTGKYLNTKISIHITVLESDGSEWSASVNAISFALLQSDIQLYDIVSAVELLTVKDDDEKEDRILVDPTIMEIETFKKSTRIIVCYLPVLQQIVNIQVIGRSIPREKLIGFIDIGISICKQLKSFLQKKFVE